MNRQQQTALLLASLVLWTFGNASMGIWPLYAVALGASPAATGNFLALGFLGMAAGRPILTRICKKPAPVRY